MLSVIINGEPVGYFGVSRGLKQGDALSPSLFALAEDVLSRNIIMLREMGKISPMISFRNYQCPTHLLFADDIIIFLNGNVRCLRKMLKLLTSYQATAGQILNMDKSRVFLGGMNYSRKVTVLNTVKLKEAYLPEKYVGINLVKGRVTKEAVSNVVDIFSKRLTAWQGSAMSI
ncbi:hypothetical protein ACHQM5_001194 [Ranunculus cassubicifolius]